MSSPSPLDYATPVARSRRRLNWRLLAFLVVGFALILAVLAFVLVPVRRSGPVPNRLLCSSNLSQIGKALVLYSNDDPDGAYPAGFADLLLTQDITSDVFVCRATSATPASRVASTEQGQAILLSNPSHCSYIACFSGLNVRSDADDVLALEPLSNHGGNGANVLFGDGHVEFIPAGPNLQKALQDAAAGVRPVRIK